MQLLPSSGEIPNKTTLIAAVQQVRSRLSEVVANADSHEQYIDPRIRNLVVDILSVEDHLRILPQNEQLSREIYTQSYQFSRELKHLSRKINDIVPILESSKIDEMKPLAIDTAFQLTHFSSWLKETQSILVSREAKRDFPIGGLNFGERKDMEAVQTHLWGRGLDKSERDDHYTQRLLDQLQAYQTHSFSRTFLSRFSIRDNNEYYSFNVLKVIGKLLIGSGGYKSEVEFRMGFRPLMERVQINAAVSLSMDIVEFMKYMGDGNVKKTYLHQAEEIKANLNSFYNRHLTLEEKALYRDPFRALSKSLDKIEKKYS